jgi:hypothetical protein
MKAGDTFLMPAPGISTRTPHLWIVLTDPTAENSTVVIVSVTTLRHGADQTIILMPGEHPFVRRPSAVFYADALLVDVLELDDKAKLGHIQMREPCSAGTLANIRAGVSASDLTPQKVQRFYENLVKPK